MAGVCTPVSVVTTVCDGRPFGTTVSAFASQSMDPPMMLVSLAADSTLLDKVRRTGVFGLNVLRSDQAALAGRFATKDTDKFRGLSWAEDHGAARLPGVGVWAACHVVDLVRAGDHWILLGEVASCDCLPVEPLTYHDRAFGTHVAG